MQDVKEVVFGRHHPMLRLYQRYWLHRGGREHNVSVCDKQTNHLNKHSDTHAFTPSRYWGADVADGDDEVCVDAEEIVETDCDDEF